MELPVRHLRRGRLIFISGNESKAPTFRLNRNVWQSIYELILWTDEADNDNFGLLWPFGRPYKEGIIPLHTLPNHIRADLSVQAGRPKRTHRLTDINEQQREDEAMQRSLNEFRREEFILLPASLHISVSLT